MVHKGSNYDRRYFRRRFDLFRNGAGNPHKLQDSGHCGSDMRRLRRDRRSRCCENGWSIPAAMVLAFIAGVLCGLCTAAIHNHLHIPGLLAGILTMTMLYSVNLRILGNKANVPLVRVDTMYDFFHQVFAFMPQALSQSVHWAAMSRL